MTDEALTSPVAFLQERLAIASHAPLLDDYEGWWRAEGAAISAAVDRAGTPWLRMHDRFGARIDEILFPPGYRRLLLHGYRAGIIWRAFAEQSLLPHYLLGYVTSFFDPGLYCPYTVSMSTAAPLSKYADAGLRQRFLDPMLRRDDGVWQGATWMTEIGGGSDLGAHVQTAARRDGEGWRLSGDKYFASNAGAEVAVVAARPEGAPAGVKGLALFVVGRQTLDGRLNYTVRRLKDKIATRSVPTGEVELRDAEGWLLGPPEAGVYLILEVLNCSRVANCVGSVALAQRALAEARHFAAGRIAFGRPILEQPLLRAQFAERRATLDACFALAFEAVRRLDQVWRQTPPYSDDYHLFRLVAHLAKYWTAEEAAQTAKWAMEVHGGLGVLAEYPVERLLREIMILAIWEGTRHRQALDGLEVMERRNAHRLLLDALAKIDPTGAAAVLADVETYLQQPREAREAGAEMLFNRLARFAGTTLARQGQMLAPG